MQGVENYVCKSLVVKMCLQHLVVLLLCLSGSCRGGVIIEANNVGFILQELRILSINLKLCA